MSTSRSNRVLVLGGGYAGIFAASRIASSASGASVTLVDARPAFVQRVRMHELLAGSEPAQLPYAPAMTRRGAEFQQGFVEQVELDAGHVRVRTEAGDRRLAFDTLVIALGSRTGASAPGVAEHAVRLNEPVIVHSAADRLRRISAGARIVVVGGGLTATETASELAERYPAARVTMLVAGRFGSAFSKAGELHMRRRLSALRVDLREGVAVAAVQSGEVFLADGSAVRCDVCVWAAGFEAAAQSRDAGLRVLGDGRAIVEPTLQVAGRENVFAAGDAAAVGLGSDVLRMGCVSAGPLGAHAGDNVARFVKGEPLAPFAFSFFVRCISLGRRDGLVQFTRENDEPVNSVVRGRSAAVVKELVCRLAYANVLLETRRIRSAWWPKARAAARLDTPTLELRTAG